MHGVTTQKSYFLPLEGEKRFRTHMKYQVNTNKFEMPNALVDYC